MRLHNRKDLPKELYDLDVLDGSPPCSSFSLAGQRDKHWGKAKKFVEGQAMQILDTLFFDFIDLAKELQPKVVISENVVGLTQGKAKPYLTKILAELDLAGYDAQYHILDASCMGVPQSRKRVFIFGLRKDLSPMVSRYCFSLFDINKPILNLDFNEPKINFSAIDTGIESGDIAPCILQYYHQTKQGDNFSTVHPTGSYFSIYKAHPDRPLVTISGVNQKHSNIYHPTYPRALNKQEVMLGSSFPLDFNFGKVRPLFACAMSVPPVMMANIADKIYEQWINMNDTFELIKQAKKAIKAKKSSIFK